MSLTRTSAWLATLISVLSLAASARAQHLQPFGPTGQEQDLEPFAPADLSQYGSGPCLNRGWFFQYDRMYWSLTVPKRRDIGEQSLEVLGGFNNSLDTSMFGANFAWGNRYEGGYVLDDSTGWLASYTGLGDQFQDRSFIGPDILFLGGFVANPPNFSGIVLHQNTKYDSVELMHTHRYDVYAHGGVFEWMVGTRYISIDDIFNVTASGGPLDVTTWNTDAKNNLVGPQVAARWYSIRERWMLDVQGRFLAAANFENVVQDGVTASNSVLLRTAFNSVQHSTVFAPVGELRVDTSYEVTKSVALKLGYTLTYIGGITRAADRVNYSLPYFGINDTNKTDFMFINGVNFGIEFNR